MRVNSLLNRAVARGITGTSITSASSSSTCMSSSFLGAQQMGMQQIRSFAYDSSIPAHEKIKKLTEENDVMLFMKGNPIFPQCGFSRQVCEVLKREGFEGKFHSVNVLEDQDIREGVKSYSDWPTIPQLYIKGEFVGGCDIVIDMYRSGEMKEALKDCKP